MKGIDLFNSSYLSLVLFITNLFDIFVLKVTRISASTKGLAVVRLDAIGDFILWLNTAKEIRRLYPKVKITLVANRTWADLADRLPFWDEVIAIDRKQLVRNPIYRWKTLQRVRRLGVETAIQPTFSRDLRGDHLIRATGALQRIGSIGDLTNMTTIEKKMTDRWYTELVPASKKPLMDIQRNAEFIRGLAPFQLSADMPALPGPVTLLPPSLLIREPYFILFPGSLDPIRRWPAKRFGRLLAELSKSGGIQAVLCGSEEERGLCDRVVDISNVKALNLAGKTLLPEFVEVVRSAGFIVSNETSAVHIAAVVETPSVCILGGGHYGRFVPYAPTEDPHCVPVPVMNRMDCYNCNWNCTQPHNKKEAAPCIDSIRVEQVMEAVEQILAEENG